MTNNFRRTLTRLRRQAVACQTTREAARIRDAGYRAQGRARGEIDCARWDAMLDAVEALSCLAHAAARTAEAEREAALWAESARTRHEARIAAWETVR